MNIDALFDEATSTLTYLVWDPKTRDAVVIDPVLDYNPLGSQTSTAQLQRLDSRIKSRGVNLLYVLETHAHADHLSGSQYLKAKYGAKLAIGEHIRVVQEAFKKIYDADFATDGSQFDVLLSDGETLHAGSITIEVIATPGHTPACVTYKIEDALFTGDALFMDDYGTGRCDFPSGSAADLFDSVKKLYAMADETRVFVGHDYRPGGRELAYQTTIGRSKANNPQLSAHTTKEEFVAMREARDATLPSPKLLFPSVQVNVDGGQIPRPRANGIRYLSLPLNLFRPTDDLGEQTK